MPVLDPNVYVNTNIDPVTNLQPTTKIDPMSGRLGSNVLPMGEAGVSKYDTGINRFNIGEIERLRGEQQSGLAQFGNALNQAVVGEVIGGTIEGIGWLGAFQDSKNLLDEKEVELGNMLTEMGQSIRNWTQDVTPVYKTYNQGDFSPAKWSWWMNNFPSVASTLSLLIPAAGAVKGASMLGKAAGIPNLAKMGAAAGMTTRGATLFEKGVIGISQAVVSRHMENLMEASGKYQEIYDIAKQRGLSDQKAREQASIAASDIYKTDWAMLAFDIPQYLLLGKSYGKAVQELGVQSAKAMGASLMKPVTRKILDTTGNLLGEGAEEAFQYVTAEHYGELAKHRMDPSYKVPNLVEYLKDGEMWTNAFFGLFGAGVFQTAGRYVNKKLFGATSEDEDRADQIRSISPMIKKLTTARYEAESLGNQTAVQHINERIAATLAGMHSETGTFDKFIADLESISGTDPKSEDLERYGLELSDVDNIKANFPAYIEIANQVKEAYEVLMSDKQKNYSPRTASQIATSSIMKMKLSEQLTKLNSQEKDIIGSLHTEDSDYNKLSPIGKDLIEKDINIFTLEAQLKELKHNRELNIADERKQTLDVSIKRLENTLKNLNKERNQLSMSKEYIPKDRKNDKERIPRINKFLLDKYININKDIKELEEKIEVENEIVEFGDLRQDVTNKIQTGKDTRRKEPIIPTQTKEEREQDLINKYRKSSIEEKVGIEKEFNELQTAEGGKKDIKDEVSKIEEEEKRVQDEARIKQERYDKYSATPINELLKDKNSGVTVYKTSPTGEGVQGTLYKKSSKYYTKWANEEEKEFEGNINESPLQHKFIVVSDIASYKSILPVKTEDGSDNIPIPDIGITEADIVVNQTIDGEKKVTLRASYFPDGPNGDEKLHNYLKDRSNDLSGAFIDVKINTESYSLEKNEDLANRLKRALKGELSFKDLEKDLDKIPITGTLNDKGRVISDKVFIYGGDYTTKRVLPKEYDIEDYVEGYKVLNRQLRRSIIESLLKGESVRVPVSGKTRGTIKKQTANYNFKNVADALNTDLIKLKGKSLISLTDGRLMDINGDIKAITNSGRGSVFIETDKTCNGENYLLRVFGEKVSKEHAEIIYNTYVQAITEHNGWNNAYVGKDVEGGFSNGVLLATLVNFGENTKVTNTTHGSLKETNISLYQNLKAKQLYLDGTILHYGNNGEIDFSNTPSKEEKKTFIEYITTHLNYAYRHTYLSKPMTSPIRIGSFKLTQDDIDAGINTFELFALKNGYVKSNVEIDPNLDTILEKPDITLNITSPDQLTLTNAKTVDVVEPITDSTTPDITPDVMKEVNDIMDEFGFGSSTPTKHRLYTNPRAYQIWDKNKELTRLRTMLGEHIPVDIVDKVIETIDDKGTTRHSWGIVQDAAIILYKNTESGTVYHEAFHIVFNYILNKDEQRAIIKDAKTKYPSLKNATRDEIEEYVAERFRDYVMGKPQSPKNKLTDTIRRIFDRLIDFIKHVFVNKSTKISTLTIDKLFDKIESGSYRKTKIGDKYKHKGKIWRKSIQDLRKVYTKEQINRITDAVFCQLVMLNKLVDIEDIGVIDYELVRNHFIKIKDKFKEVGADPKFTEKQKEAFLHYEELWNNVTSEDQWPSFQRLVENRLFALNVKKKIEDKEDEDIENFTSKEFQRFEKAAYEFDSKDSILDNVKLFIATLPESTSKKDVFTGTYKLVDFHTAWSRVMKDAWVANDVKELISIFDTKAKRSEFYSFLLDGVTNKAGEVLRQGIRNADTNFATQLLAAFKKHRHTFINTLIEDGKYKVVSASLSDAHIEAAKEWSISFYENNIKWFNEDETELSEEGQAKLKEISFSFTKNILAKSLNEYISNNKSFPNYNSYIKDIISLFSKFYITLDEYTLDSIFEDLGNEIVDESGVIVGKDKHSGLKKFIDTYMTNIFNPEKSLIADLKNKSAFTKTYKKKTEQILAENILANNSNIKNLAGLVIKHNDDYVQDVVLGPDNAMYYTYSQSSFLTDWHRRIKKEMYLENLIQTVSNITPTGKIASELLRQVKEEKKNLRIVTIANFRTKQGRRSKNKGYLQLNDKEDFLMKFHLMNPMIISQKACLPLPTLADKKQYFAFTGIDLLKIDGATYKDGVFEFKDTSHKVIDVFTRWYDAESNRITKTKEVIDAAFENEEYSNLIKNIHYQDLKDDGTPVLFDKDGNYTGNGMKRLYFQDEIPRKLSGLNKLINDRTDDTIELAVKLKIIKRGSNGSLKNELLDSRLFEAGKDAHPLSYMSKYGTMTKAIRALMTEYTINTIMSNIETDKVFAGDAAFYKLNEKTDSVYEDKIKRISELVAPGDLLRTDFESDTIKLGDLEIQANLKRTNYNVGSIRDHIVNVSNVNKEFIDTLKGLFKEQGLNDAEVTFRLKAFEKNNTTDASSYITPEFHRELKIRLGVWRKWEEEAYQLIMKDPFNISSDKMYLVNKLSTEPLKFVHYGLYNKNGYSVPIYNKMAMFTVWPHMTKQGSVLRSIYDKMVQSKMDMLNVESAVKVGATPMPKIVDAVSEELIPDRLNKILIKEQSLDNLRRQQITTPHESSTRVLATQVRKIVMANIKKTLDYIVDGKSIKGEKLVNNINDIYSELSNRGTKKLENILGINLSKGTIDVRKLYEKLQTDAINGNMPQQIVDALTIKENGEKVNIDTLADRKWVETKVLALISKQTVDITTPGTEYAQMSSFGMHKKFDDRLKMMTKDNRTEVMVSVDLYKHIIPNYNSISFKEKQDWLEKHRDLIEGIGYRIPTQGQNSVISFVVKEFLPEVSKNTIILPAEFTTITGSDFDIDKTFLSTYNYVMVGGELKKVEYFEGDKKGNITDEADLRNIYYQTYIKDMYMRDKLKEIVKEAKTITINLLSKLDKDEEFTLKYESDLLEKLLKENGLKSITINEVKDIITKYDQKIPDIDKWIKDNKGKPAIKVNNDKALQNRLLSLMKGVITSNNHILETKTPLDTFTKQIQDLVELVRKAKGLNKKLSSLEAVSPAYQLLVKSAFTGGKKGIGPFALHNVHHSLTQVYEVITSNVGAWGLQDKEFEGFVALNQAKGKDGFFILDWLSALINAHVDIAKDPYIFDLNVNQRTYDLINYLIRGGAGKKAFLLLVQPAASATKKDKFEELAISKLRGLSKTETAKLEAQTLVKDEIEKYSNPDDFFTMSEKEMLDDIEEGTKPISERSWEWFARQEGIRLAYKELSKQSRDLSAIVHSSRIDNKGYGNTSIEIKDFDSKFEESLKIASKRFIQGARELLENSFLNTMKNNTFNSASVAFNEITFTSTELFEEMHRTIMKNVKFPVKEDFEEYGEYINAKEDYARTFDKMERELFSSIVSRYFHNSKGFNFNSKEKVKELMFGKNAVAARLHKLANEYPDIRENYLVKQLRPIKPLRELKLWLIKTLNGDKTDRFKRDNITGGWEELLEHSNIEVRKLGEDLVVLAFLTSGFNRRLYSFHHDIPIEFLMKRSDFLDKTLSVSYNEFISQVKNDFTSGSISYDERNEIINDVIKNNPDVIQSYYLQERDIKKVIDLKNNQPVFFRVPLHNGVIDPLYYQRVQGIDNNDFYGELIGFDRTNMEVLYRILVEKGLDEAGHHVYENVYNGSVFNEYNEYTDEQLIEGANTTKHEKFKGNKTYNFELIDLEDRADFNKRIEEYMNMEDRVLESIDEKEGLGEDNREYTPENITVLNNNEIFVFGSNTEGRHGKGAAKVAKNKFGAKYGQSRGLQGQSYAIITKDLSKGEKSIPLQSSFKEPISISLEVEHFLRFALDNPNLKFYVTKIGSSLAGYSVDQIRSIFKNALHSIPDNVILPKEYEVRGELKSTTEKSTPDFAPTGIQYSDLTNEQKEGLIKKFGDFAPDMFNNLSEEDKLNTLNCL